MIAKLRDWLASPEREKIEGRLRRALEKTLAWAMPVPPGRMSATADIQAARSAREHLGTHLSEAWGVSADAGQLLAALAVDPGADHASIAAEGPAALTAASPWFDMATARTGLADRGLAPGDDDDVARVWAERGAPLGVVPSGHFDAKYYRIRYPATLVAGKSAFAHFLLDGAARGLSPSLALEPVARHACKMTPAHPGKTLGAVLDGLPAGFADFIAATDGGTIARLFRPDLYRKAAGLPQDTGNRAAFWHYVCEGRLSDPRPAWPLVEDKLYRSRWQNADTAQAPGLGPRTDPWLHWLVHGRRFRIVPSRLFDEAYYTASHPDLVVWQHWAYEHFLRHGLYENRRSNRLFEPSWYAAHYKLGPREAALADYLCGGSAAGRAAAASVDLNAFSDVAVEDRLVAGLERLEARLDRLEQPDMQALVAHAAAIEPLVMRPYGIREVQWPPVRHGQNPVIQAETAMRAALPRKRYDTVVMIPHCRLSGAARIAGDLTRALKRLWPHHAVLLVLTDLDEFWRPDWFGVGEPGGPDVLNLPKAAPGAAAEVRAACLLALLRGVQPARVFNANSRACWDMWSTYARQLAHEMDLYAYLFCWDIDVHGNKTGYPIREFQRCFDHLSGVFVDNAPLSAELADRYCMPPALARRLEVLHTPAETDVAFDHGQIFAERRTSGAPLTCFWAGRFDRQKRFDVVVGLARLMPELTIEAWGKKVIGDDLIDLDNLPPNIRLMGVYERIDDLALGEMDFFLYTSQWDGLPTVLIETGMRSLPTVASLTGGIGDLISERTGWPVEDVLDPQAYARAISAMCADPDETVRRAQTYRRVTADVCSQTQFDDGIRRIVEPVRRACEETA